MKRTYRLGKRADGAADTRERILSAVHDLYEGAGPRAATVTEAARRAGVDRLTVYKHFPDEAALVAGWHGRWAARHPLPDLLALVAVEDPEERLRRALTATWGWYAETRVVTAAVLRDGPAMLGFAPVMAGWRAWLAGGVEVLALGRRRTPALAPTLWVATAFPTWEALVAEGGLRPEAAAAVVEGWVEAAEIGGPGPRGGVDKGARSRRGSESGDAG